MAAGIARKVFGQGHAIVSAGAETATGLPIAKNAVSAAEEIGIDISAATTTDVDDLNLSEFDLIVVLQPSSAQAVRLPPNVVVDHIDVPDPYGTGLGTYRKAVGTLLKGVRRLYVRDAIRRGGVAAGSHVAGVFNRAAKQLEKELYEFVVDTLGLTVHSKITLGQMAELLAEDAVTEGAPAILRLSEALRRVNEHWVKVKHRDDPTKRELLSALKAVQECFLLLERTVL